MQHVLVSVSEIRRKVQVQNCTTNKEQLNMLVCPFLSPMHALC